MADHILQPGTDDSFDSESLLADMRKDGMSDDSISLTLTRYVWRKIHKEPEQTLPQLLPDLEAGEYLPTLLATTGLCFAKLGETAAPAVPGLARAIDSPDYPIPVFAAYALGEIGQAAKPAVPALIKGLQHERPEVRWAAADSLGQIGPGALEAVDPLFAIRDSRKAPFSILARAILEILPETAKEGDVAKLSVQADTWMDTVLREQLYFYLPWVKPSIQHLLRRLRDAKSSARYWAAVRLAAFGSDAEAAVPALLQALNDSEADIRCAVDLAVFNISNSRFYDKDRRLASFLHTFLTTVFDPAKLQEKDWTHPILEHPWLENTLKQRTAHYAEDRAEELINDARANLLLKLARDPTLNYKPEQIATFPGWIDSVVEHRLSDAGAVDRSKKRTRKRREEIDPPDPFGDDKVEIKHSSEGIEELSDSSSSEPVEMLTCEESWRQRLEFFEQVRTFLRTIKSGELRCQIFFRHFFEGQTYEQIGADLGLVDHQVKHHCKCALKFAQEHFRDHPLAHELTGLRRPRRSSRA